MRIAGIDPGKTGAIAVVIDGRCVEIHDLPHIAVGRVGSAQRLDIPATAAIILKLPVDLVCIEEPTPRPREASAGACRVGYGYGAICALVHVRDAALMRVPPSTWTGGLRLPGKARQPGAGIAMARELYPEAAEWLAPTPRGRARDGRADALLLAHWAATRRER